MATGKINLQKASGGITAITGVDGTGNTQLVLPESGTVATTAGATETSTGLIELATTAEAQAGTDDTRAITPLKLKNSVLGLGQTWQSFTVGTQRISGTTYTNTTSKPIVVFLNISINTGGGATMVVNGVSTTINVGYSGVGIPYTIIIPNGVTYQITAPQGISTWMELR